MADSHRSARPRALLLTARARCRSFYFGARAALAVASACVYVVAAVVSLFVLLLTKTGEGSLAVASAADKLKPPPLGSPSAEQYQPKQASRVPSPRLARDRRAGSQKAADR